MDVNKCLMPAIDVHGHYGRYQRLGNSAYLNQWMSASAQTVVKRAQCVSIHTTIVSPLQGLISCEQIDVLKANEDAARLAAELDGLFHWVVVHPLEPRSYEQAAEMLQTPACVGIKIHPEEHAYKITQYGQDLFSFAARHQTIVMAHSGDPRSLPNDFVPWANEFPEMRLILAHLGNGGGAGGEPQLQVEAINACKYGNVYTDTSSSRSLVPGLIEWAVTQVGVDRILFGTDTPLYSTAAQRARIDQASLSETEKRAILYDNAATLLPLPITQKTTVSENSLHVKS